MAFVEFMESSTGRLARIVAGLVLVGTGAWFGGAFWVLAAVGVVPVAAGVLGLCLLAPLFHAPLRGAAKGG